MRMPSVAGLSSVRVIDETLATGRTAIAGARASSLEPRLRCRRLMLSHGVPIAGLAQPRMSRNGLVPVVQVFVRAALSR